MVVDVRVVAIVVVVANDIVLADAATVVDFSIFFVVYFDANVVDVGVDVVTVVDGCDKDDDAVAIVVVAAVVVSDNRC